MNCLRCLKLKHIKYVRGYCIYCYNYLRKYNKINNIAKPIMPTSLTLNQEEVLSGLMLGDGCLSKRGKNGNAQLIVERSTKDQLYLDDNFNIFKEFCKSGIKIRIRGSRTHCNFKTRNSEAFNTYYNIWYPNGVKIVPSNINLTPLTCAIWFCDDGLVYRSAKKARLRLCTQGFTKEQNYLLSDKLSNIINEKIRVDYYKYYFLSGEIKATKKFIEYINNYIPISMDRKRKYFNLL